MGHWRKTIAECSKTHKVYAIDLLGFGASAKPIQPYTMELWGELILDFSKVRKSLAVDLAAAAAAARRNGYACRLKKRRRPPKNGEKVDGAPRRLPSNPLQPPPNPLQTPRTPL